MSERNPKTEPSSETAQEDIRDSSAAHQADRAPTPDEEELAEESDLDPSVAEHEQEMMERGARVKGEGRIS